MQDLYIGILRNLDLNLLPILDALLETGSVTQAASQLHVSQPAISHALRRLRETLDDPLFVRTAGGLVPTPRCRALQPTLRRILRELAGVILTKPVFDPAAEKRTFTIGMTDYSSLLLLPPLMDQLRQVAPGIQIQVRAAEEPGWLAVDSGTLDLSVLLSVEERPGIFAQPLYTDSFQCLVRKDHPVVRKNLTLERYLELAHVLISPQGHGQGFVDMALAQKGLSRYIALRVPYFLAAPLIVARTDLVLTLPTSLAQIFSEHFALRVVTPPLQLSEFTLKQVWHERHQGDPGHAFVRGLLRDIAKGPGFLSQG